jgi:hypothetical protein
MIENPTEYREGFFGELWSDYAARCIPEAAPLVQTRLMEQSFLAGAVSYMCALSCIMATSDDAATVGQRVDTLEDEVKAMTTGITQPLPEAVIEAEAERIEDAITDDLVKVLNKSHPVAPGQIAVRIFTANLSEDDGNELAQVVAQFVAGVEAKRDDQPHSKPTLQ